MEKIAENFLKSDAGSNIIKNMTSSQGGVTPNPIVPKTTAERTSASDDYMCKGFQEMFMKNQRLYGDKVFDSLATYFTDEPVKIKLTSMLEKHIGGYIDSETFRGTTSKIIESIIGDVIRKSLVKELENGRNFEGICGELSKFNNTVGGATRSKRKRRKRTVKRRS
jgi:hypothetical protein